MKDFDIEKLERTQIYRTPENFFEEMQRNVMHQVSPQKKTRIIPVNWAYAAAAAVATLFGLTFFVTQGEAAPEPVAQMQEISTINALEDVAIATEPKQEARLAYQTLASDLTLVSDDHQKETKAGPTEVTAKAKAKTAPKPSAEIQVDQILGTITSAELADLGRNVEQDVYLDLYY